MSYMPFVCTLMSSSTWLKNTDLAIHIKLVKRWHCPVTMTASAGCTGRACGEWGPEGHDPHHCTPCSCCWSGWHLHGGDASVLLVMISLEVPDLLSRTGIISEAVWPFWNLQRNGLNLPIFSSNPPQFLFRHNAWSLGGTS